jgi:hypothetical protein
LPFSSIEDYRFLLTDALTVMEKNNVPIPADPPAQYIPPDIYSPTPLGSKAKFLTDSRFNLRNAVRDGDSSQTPLQFVYEACNCRLFYQTADLYDITGVWMRAAAVAWGSAKCVSDSTVNSDGSMGAKATDTVPWSDKVNSKVSLPAQPGLLPIGSTPGTGGGNATGGDEKKNDASWLKTSM